MKKAEQLRLETDKLENEITSLLKEFVDKVGFCYVRIDTDIVHSESIKHGKRLSYIGVKVNATV